MCRVLRKMRRLLTSAPFAMGNDIIYLDNNATTQIDPAVVQEMLPFLTENYGNPSSGYRFGQRVNDALEIARARVAGLLGCEPSEILFTSCGTESSNTAIHSALQMDRDRQHIVTTRVEHSATLKTCEGLAKRGYAVTWLGVNSEGQIDLGELERAVTDETALVSIMWANNETGVTFPIEKISEIVRAKGAVFHTDAVQTIGKLPVKLDAMKVNFLSLSGHKLHAPKGVGVLYVNRRTKFFPFVTGGGQENGKRAGTQNVASIVALGKACEIASQNIAHEATEVMAMRDEFENAILAKVPGTQVNGDRVNRLPNTTSLAFSGTESEAMLMLLDQQGLCCSAGSACTTGQHEPSHVLRAMGFDDTRARGSLRFSYGRFNTRAEVARALELVPQVVEKVRRVTAA
jgi:cysteine desulfurase